MDCCELTSSQITSVSFLHSNQITGLSSVTHLISTRIIYTGIVSVVINYQNQRLEVEFEITNGWKKTQKKLRSAVKAVITGFSFSASDRRFSSPVKGSVSGN